MQIIRNNRPVSPLRISSKIFEKIMFNSLLKYLKDNKQIFNQSGFRYGDSFVHQLFSVTHKIYKLFDTNLSLEVRGIFEISKAFEQVWHDGLLYTPNLLGIYGDTAN